MTDWDERGLVTDDVAQRWRLQIAADMHAAAAELTPLDPLLADEYRERARRWMAPPPAPLPDPPGWPDGPRRFRRVK